jgi:Protein of unknown function (DUF1257)
MSHFSSVQTAIKDKECLVSALKELGLNAVVHQNNQPIQGYYGDSQGYSAEIVIPARTINTRSDVGFRRIESGEYQLVQDLYETRNHRQFGQRFVEEKVMPIYGSHLVRKIARSQYGENVEITETKAENGKITMRVQIPQQRELARARR